MPASPLPAPHGGRAVDLVAAGTRAAELTAAAGDWPSWTLGAAQLADLELLASGAYAPLRGFATEDEHASVVENGRLPDGTLWPLPITLDVDAAAGEDVEVGGRLGLRDGEGVLLAVLHVASRWRPSPERDARGLLGTDDPAHREVAALLARAGEVRVGGEVEVVEPPGHHDLAALRATPAAVRAALAELGWPAALALHLRGVPGLPLLERVGRTLEELGGPGDDDPGAGLVWQLPTGPGEPGDLDRFVRARLAERLRGRLDAPALVRAVPLAVRLAGPRETVLRAIVAQNHGATHLLLGPDDATSHLPEQAPAPFSPGSGQRRLLAAAEELEIVPVPVARQVHLPGTGVVDADRVPAGGEPVDRTEPELREALARDLEVPEELVPPEVIDELRRAWPPRHRRGLTVFLTGLSGSGKSTIANVVRARLLEVGGRSVTLLDGDLVRRNLSSELGFSKRDRDLNVLRIGYVASEITRHGGIAICAPIAPYDAVRRRNRTVIEGTGGGYVLVHVATPLEVCEARDRKGLYARARAGEIRDFTGIDDVYELPGDADVTVDTTDIDPEEAAEVVLAHLEVEGWWPPRD